MIEYMEDYVVYCLYSERFDQIYIGFTNSLIQRFHSHNKLSKKGWTVRYRPWMVAYVEFYTLKSKAKFREKQLKSFRGREFLRAYISENYFLG